MVASLDGRQRHVLLRDARPVAAVPGFLLYLRRPTLLAQALDATRLQLSGDGFPLPEGVRLVSGPYWLPSQTMERSPTGRRIPPFTSWRNTIETAGSRDSGIAA